MDVIKTLDELDARLIRLEAALKVSDEALRKEFDLFRMDFPAPTVADPDSDEYRREQFAIYERIAAKRYDTANEVTSFDPIPTANRPFPYYTEGWEVIGDQIIATGFILKTLKLPAGASVLEFGPGWGNTTIALARSGYDVTCIEIEQNFVSLVEERARRLSLPVKAIKGDFLDADKLSQKFDAILFYECFHHCADHNALLDRLEHWIKPGGIVAFAAEPITDAFHAPWGIRSDGQTLWAIRTHGWLELGFTEKYFRHSLNRRGWAVDLHESNVSHLARIFVARRGTQRVTSRSLPLKVATRLRSLLDRVVRRLSR